MDNGLDIMALRMLLALHAALHADPVRLERVLAGRDRLDERIMRAAQRVRADGLALDLVAADRALDWCQQPRHGLLIRDGGGYPPRLAAIAMPPVLLFVDGARDLLTVDQIAVVGSRAASPAGLAIAFEWAEALAAGGVAVTSGLARGIDAAAHRGALAGRGATLAVLGCGIDRVYPAAHRDLARRVIEHGALVSEFPLGAAPLAAHFPRRNRVISGLSLGVLVIEAALRSGSLSTALHAVEQGREVFAVPGSIRNPLSRGCHALIKQGAKLCEDIEDIVEEMPSYALRAPPLAAPAARSGGKVDDCAAFLSACGWDPFSLDELALRSGLTVQELSSMLIRLELAGIVEAHGSGLYQRVR